MITLNPGSELKSVAGKGLLGRSIATIDFHVTSECSQECPYCWGPQGFDRPVSTRTAEKILRKIKEFGIGRVVFTGGDPLQRRDLGRLVRYAGLLGLEVAISSTGDRLTASFLRRSGKFIDLISLPLDGSNELTNCKTKEKGHFRAVMKALRLLSQHPGIDVKICTPVTKSNIRDVKNIARLVARWAGRTRNRVFYNVFQTFPRSMVPRDWESLLVSDREFQALRTKLRDIRGLKINFLSAQTLDRLYALIFPNGDLYVPSGTHYNRLGAFLDIENLEKTIAGSDFDARKHLKHSREWEKSSLSNLEHLQTLKISSS